MLQKPVRGWLLLGTAIFCIIIIPFALFGASIEAWTQGFLERSESNTGWISLVLGGLLAADIVLPVPSSLLSTGAGVFLGFALGTFVSWLGMTAGACTGYLLGRYATGFVSRRLVGPASMHKLKGLSQRYGDWMLIVSRPVPVLAEAGVFIAGMSGMPFRRFFALATLSNLGISAAYAAVGAFAASLNSFLLAFVGAVGLPALTMLLLRRTD